MFDYLAILTEQTELVVLFVLAAIFLSYLREARGQGFSVPFGLLTASVIMLILSFLPAWMTEWLPYLKDIQPPDAVSMLVLAIVISAGIWMVVYILKRDSTPQPETIADHVFKKFGQVVDSYARIAGLFLLFITFFGYAILTNFAEVLGQIGNVVAMEPFLASNVLSGLAGFAALGGEIPIIGELPVLRSLSPTGWLVLVALLLLAAAMAYYDARGQTSRLFR